MFMSFFLNLVFINYLPKKIILRMTFSKFSGQQFSENL